MGYLIMIYARRPEQVRHIVTEHPASTVGVYAFPSKESNVSVCPGASRCGHTSWMRHDDGYLIHACGARHKDWRRRFIGSLFDLLGMNLLPRTRTPKQFQNPTSWEPTKKRPHSGE
jgi:hypothetical protein